MSLPHWQYTCDHCDFHLSSGPDCYDSSSNFTVARQQLWGSLCSCAACGEIHLVANVSMWHAPEERFLYFLVRGGSKRTGETWQWRKSVQSFWFLPHYATGAERRAEVIDISKARCTACGQSELKLSLYHGMDCPSCKSGKLTESFTG